MTEKASFVGTAEKDRDIGQVQSEIDLGWIYTFCKQRSRAYGEYIFFAFKLLLKVCSLVLEIQLITLLWTTEFFTPAALLICSWFLRNIIFLLHDAKRMERIEIVGSFFL